MEERAGDDDDDDDDEGGAPALPPPPPPPSLHEHLQEDSDSSEDLEMVAQPSRVVAAPPLPLAETHALVDSAKEAEEALQRIRDMHDAGQIRLGSENSFVWGRKTWNRNNKNTCRI